MVSFFKKHVLPVAQSLNPRKVLVAQSIDPRKLLDNKEATCPKVQKSKSWLRPGGRDRLADIRECFDWFDLIYNVINLPCITSKSKWHHENAF